MKVVAIADIQGQCWDIPRGAIPSGDLLVVAGDLAGFGNFIELNSFNNWLGELPHPYKVVVAGNHDLGLARGLSGKGIFTNATYLEDEMVEMGGLRIYGSPVNDCGPYAAYWEFCKQPYIGQATAKIPPGLDILITHGPPYRTLDLTLGGEYAGSKDLASAVAIAQPKCHIFGHIHEQHGWVKRVGRLSVNAAICSATNRLLREPGKLFYEPIIVDTKAWEIA